MIFLIINLPCNIFFLFFKELWGKKKLLMTFCFLFFFWLKKQGWNKKKKNLKRKENVFFFFPMNTSADTMFDAISRDLVLAKHAVWIQKTTKTLVLSLSGWIFTVCYFFCIKSTCPFGPVPYISSVEAKTFFLSYPAYPRVSSIWIKIW